MYSGKLRDVVVLLNKPIGFLAYVTRGDSQRRFFA